MIHYTLNTGHSRVSPREEVASATLAACRPLLAPGDHPIPVPGGYALAVAEPVAGGWLGTVYGPGRRPLITVAVAADDGAADAVWPVLESFYLRITEAPGLRSADFAASARPASTPWCAAITIGATAEEGYWLGDFERCLAWAWITQGG